LYALNNIYNIFVSHLPCSTEGQPKQRKCTGAKNGSWDWLALTIYAKSHDGCDKLADKSESSNDNSSQLRKYATEVYKFYRLCVLDVFDKQVMC